MKKVKCLIVSVMLVLATVLMCIPSNAASSFVAVDNTLKSSDALSLFTCYGCSLESTGEGIKLVADGTNNYPFVTVGNGEWQNYILEFETYGVKVGGGFVRSTGAINHVDGFAGYFVGYDSAWMFAGSSTVSADGSSGVWEQIKDGSPFAARLAYAERLKWRIEIDGKTMNVMVTDPSTSAILAEIEVYDTVKTAGLAGFRVKSGDEGCFYNLKITITGDQAVKYAAAGTAFTTTAATTNAPASTTSAATAPVTGNAGTAYAVITAAAVAAAGICVFISVRKRKEQ